MFLSCTYDLYDRNRIFIWNQHFSASLPFNVPGLSHSRSESRGYNPVLIVWW